MSPAILVRDASGPSRATQENQAPEENRAAAENRTTEENQSNPQALCHYQDLSLLGYDQASRRQRELVALRKAGEIPDRLLFVEHPRVITLGRNAQRSHLLLPSATLARLGVDLQESDRGGDVTYHGPGQLVVYPIMNLREWRMDVGAYVRALEQVVIGAVARYGIAAGRIEGVPGVWVEGAKLAAMGVHISRWVTSHGFALNVAPEMRYFGYIVPCGLHKPVTSMERLLGRAPAREDVIRSLLASFGSVFGRRMTPLDRVRLTAADPGPAQTERTT